MHFSENTALALEHFPISHMPMEAIMCKIWGSMVFQNPGKSDIWNTPRSYFQSIPNMGFSTCITLLAAHLHPWISLLHDTQTTHNYEETKTEVEKMGDDVN